MNFETKKVPKGGESIRPRALITAKNNRPNGVMNFINDDDDDNEEYDYSCDSEDEAMNERKLIQYASEVYDSYSSPVDERPVKPAYVW